jgi:hypothetical protein
VPGVRGGGVEVGEQEGGQEVKPRTDPLKLARLLRKGPRMRSLIFRVLWKQSKSLGTLREHEEVAGLIVRFLRMLTEDPEYVDGLLDSAASASKKGGKKS